ncbi:MAG: hypothetical protein RBS80_27725 [Thermoguttaceae bacterium]|jgi:hypothetical protein|nr:hypothetical protein [Thermoguttaceae bacterium]
MLCSLSSNAWGTFVLLDNFEGYNTGAIAPQSGWWNAELNSAATVAVDPTSVGNNVLVQGSAGNRWIHFNDGMSLVPNGSVGTLFFRMCVPETAHNAISLSQVQEPKEWADGRSILRIGETTSTRDLWAWSGSGYTSLSHQLQADTWYNVWMVADNTTNRAASYYIQSDDDPALAAQTLLGSNLGFRGAAPYDDLVSVFFRTGSPGAGDVYFDDLFIDSTGVNLATPDVREAVVYREIFPNVSSANDLNLSTAGWNSRWGESAANVQVQQVARALGSPTNLLPFNSNPIDNWVTDYGYLVTHPGSDSYNHGTGGDPVLHWTEEYTVDRSYLNVREIQWRQRNNLPDDVADDAMRVAVRIEDDWFVSEQTFSNTTTSWTPMQLNFGRATWLELEFDPGSILELGAAAPFLPDGNITAFGLFADNATVTHRIDSFTILAIPEPGSAVLLAVAGLCAAWWLPRRRRRR